MALTSGLSGAALNYLNLRAIKKLNKNFIPLGKVEIDDLFATFEGYGAITTSFGASAFDLTMRAIQSLLGQGEEKK